MRPLSKEQQLRIEKFRAALENAVEHNYRAKLNNGSKRQGVSLNELPEEVRAEADKVARQYTESIYPNLKKYIAAHQGNLPKRADALPEFEPYMQDTQYKGTGPKAYGRGSWAIAGIGDIRMDGTVIARDVYSKDPPDAPHDVLANFNKFANLSGLGKGFQINGWDDGRVTFDLVEQGYFGTGTSLTGESIPWAAVSGQAGIPPEAKQGLKTWMKKLDRDIEADKQKRLEAAKKAEEKKPEKKD